MLGARVRCKVRKLTSGFLGNSRKELGVIALEWWGGYNIMEVGAYKNLTTPRKSAPSWRRAIPANPRAVMKSRH